VLEFKGLRVWTGITNILSIGRQCLVGRRTCISVLYKLPSSATFLLRAKGRAMGPGWPCRTRVCCLEGEFHALIEKRTTARDLPTRHALRPQVQDASSATTDKDGIGKLTVPETQHKCSKHSSRTKHMKRRMRSRVR
jgi:hypothetical protein